MCESHRPCGGNTHEQVHEDGYGNRVVMVLCLNGHVLERRGSPIPASRPKIEHVEVPKRRRWER